MFLDLKHLMHLVIRTHLYQYKKHVVRSLNTRVTQLFTNNMVNYDFKKGYNTPFKINIIRANSIIWQYCQSHAMWKRTPLILYSQDHLLHKFSLENLIAGVQISYIILYFMVYL